ncbi:MAG: MFS transporter [Geminicoccaceae bacterium]
MTQQLSLPRTLAYGSLGLPLAALNLPLYVLIPPFYAQELGLGLAVVGTVLLACRIVDTVSDPLIGLLSDRLPSRFGRRRPWLVVACPLLIISTFQLFAPPDGAGWLHLALWSTAAYLAWTMMLIPYSAWGAEITDDYHGRSRLALAREGCVLLGILTAAALPVLVYGGEPAAGDSLRLLTWVMAIGLPLALVAALFGVDDPQRSAGGGASLLDLLRDFRRNRPFMRLIAAYLLNGLANGLPATLFLLFVAHVLGAPDRGGVLLATYFISAIVAIPFWFILSRRLSKHRAWALSMIWACLIFAFVPFLGDGDVYLFFGICVLSGFSLGADLALPASIQADVVDEDRVVSGGRRTGVYFAIWSMATKLSLAIAVGLAFGALGAAGFQPENDADTGVWLLPWLYGGLPVAIKLIAVTFVWRFPLDQARHQELQQSLRETAS